MKREITVAVAALGFITSAVGVYAYSTDDTYICGTAGEQPLVINLEDQFDENIINTQKIKKITFSVDCKTNLDGERAYCNQGIMWYYTDGELNKRSFADIVSVNDPEYELVKCQDSICTEFVVGTDKNPLNADIDKDIKFEWTWITSDKLSMYALEVQTMDGKVYNLVSDEDYYTIEIAEKMKEEPVSTNMDCNFAPFGEGENVIITSTYGEGRDWCDHLAWDIVPVNDVEIVYAVESGIVDFSGWESSDPSVGFGQYIRIENNTSDRWFYYGHLEERYVNEGDYVEAGTPIGKYGDTGYSFGRHLHLEIRDSGDYGNKVSPAEYFDLPDEYGEINVSDINYSDLAVKCLSLNKYFEVGSLGSNGINPKDAGTENSALSLGLIQMRGSNAKTLLNSLYNADPDLYTSIAKKYDSSFINYLSKSNEWWDRHWITETSDEYRFYEELLDNDEMIQYQYNFVIEHEKNIIDDIVSSCGTTDEKYIVLFSRIYNYAPWGDTAETMRSGISYEEACNRARNDRFILRADELISLIDNNNYDIVTVDSLKGER